MTTMNSADHEVTLSDDGQGPPKADPARLPVRPGETVQWLNLLNDPVKIFFPRPEVFKEGTFGNGCSVLEIPGNGGSEVLEIAQDPPKGAHPYVPVALARQSAARFIEGGSHPIFIVR